MFRPQLLKEKKSYATNLPEITAQTLDCSLGVNPYGFPESVKAVIKGFDYNHLMDYPHSQVLYEAIISYWKDYVTLNKDQITFANGSICALYYLNNIFSQTAALKVVGFIPTFTDMAESIVCFGMEYISTPAPPDENGKLSTADLISAVTDDTCFIYIDRPNNPTGQTISLSDTEELIKAAKSRGCYVLIDEAYGDFIPRQESAMTLCNTYDNLIIIKTFSKGFGLANLRGGYIICNSQITECLAHTLNPYILSDIEREVFSAALKDASHPTAHSQEYASAKEKILSMCKNNLSMLETDMRIPIFTLMLKKPGDLQALFMKHDILTVSGRDFSGLDERFVRIRLPKPELTDKLYKAISSIESES